MLGWQRACIPAASSSLNPWTIVSGACGVLVCIFSLPGIRPGCAGPWQPAPTACTIAASPYHCPDTLGQQPALLDRHLAWHADRLLSTLAASSWHHVHGQSPGRVRTGWRVGWRLRCERCPWSSAGWVSARPTAQLRWWSGHCPRLLGRCLSAAALGCLRRPAQARDRQQPAAVTVQVPRGSHTCCMLTQSC